VHFFVDQYPLFLRLCSIITHKCTHLLIDAGHISIESDLASKEAIRQVHLKRDQQYTDDDYARLESLMYDKLNLKLEDAQVEGFSLKFMAPLMCA
jgi:vacuolar protein sorting-associated protein 13A/C